MSLYGLIIGITIIIGINYFQKYNSQLSANKQNKLIIGTLISAILGARIYHVLDLHSYYSQNPIQILNFPAGGLGIFGAFLSATFYIYIFCRKNKINFFKLINSFITIIPLCQSIGRWANFINQEGWGIATNSFLGQIFSPKGFHPVWFYESILNLCLFLLLSCHKYVRHSESDQSDEESHKNQTAFYLIGYGSIRFFLEFLRTDTWQINSIKIGQILSVLFILTGIFLITKNHKNHRPS
ncbi:prolipoprotein diacylglyceryl transferase [Patescibacteria group bacterium]|nr:prolipoprotein diacylglyceryl transferase [Patescibacteria group bacterium]MCG2701791.1 prolipoprotein diacylglyceryl transferase [Candidatus Parcubacteria bacterium]MBU4264695.1 prolipoprotein diacylglyceryl transferase [Patescibacteria group bacterium]MBU4390650.1 prolipoprotein diacylglyceryl transferase [Patescibacteria group bacterium]MBU4396767.1 prolipoprotein diacylglyceryl transferase [Patescibacteria group bacterium]